MPRFDILRSSVGICGNQYWNFALIMRRKETERNDTVVSCKEETNPD